MNDKKREEKERREVMRRQMGDGMGGLKKQKIMGEIRK